MPSHAIIVGGSVGGLSAAAAALRHFDLVTVFEKDDILGGRVADETPFETKKRRRGVPQYNEPHVFTVGGRMMMETLVPGLTKELLARGAQIFDLGTGGYVNHSGKVFLRLGTGVLCISASRRLINETIQDLVIAQGEDRLIIRDRTAVTGLLWDTEKTSAVPSVRGVVVGDSEEVTADVVLWMGGRQSQLTLPKWLEAVGVGPPPRVKVDPKSVYAARWMKLPPGHNPDKEFYICALHGPITNQRNGLAVLVEDGLVQMTLLGYGGERPPLDHEGWMAWAASLLDPAFYNLASRCEPVGPITRFASAPNAALHYHKIKLPEGLMVLGDAAMITNPIFGQGIALAAKNARTLDAVLEAAGVLQQGGAAARAAGPALQRQAYAATLTQWDICTTSDMQYPDTEVIGVWARPPPFVYKILDWVMDACTRDPYALLHIGNFVQNLAEHPSHIAVPGILWRSVVHTVGCWWRGESGKPATMSQRPSAIKSA